MDIKQKELSLKLYRFLCCVIGTKEVVKKRRQIFAVVEDLDIGIGRIGVSSGSKAEGLDLRGSDYDLMGIDNRAQVFERLDQVKNINLKVPLIMDTENIKVGFTKLLIRHWQSHFYFSTCIDRRTGFSYLPSTLVRQLNSENIGKYFPGHYMHGPCTTVQDGDVDFAVSLHCANWITQALPWGKRSKYSWASHKVIQNILSFGVLFVPIGSKNSPYADLEWRISFSYAEKQLIFCFNHVQLFCYALLKILLKDILKKRFGDLLCSYFMKTIMFWLFEETELSYWRAENMLSCFMTCFQRLVYCIENKTCFHYFIPENNLFEESFEEQHEKLLSTLHQLYDLGWTCLLQTDTLKSFRKYLEPSLSTNISLSTFLPSLAYLHASAAYIDCRAYDASLKKCMYQTIRSRKGTDFYMYFISNMCQSIAQKYYDEDLVEINNKVLYMLLRRRLSNLLIGLNRDAVSGWLLLASFFFTNKQYTVSKTIIDYCFTKITPDKYKLFRNNDLLTQNRFIEMQSIIGYRCLKNYTINVVEIRGNLSILPDELKSLLENDSAICIAPLVYVNFLDFLFYHTVGDERKKRQSYRNIASIRKYELVYTFCNSHLTNYCLQIAENLMFYEN